MRTAWSGSSSLVSDRLSTRQPQQHPQQQRKAKGKATPEPPRSKAVRGLEARLDGARGSNGHIKDPKGGCFCQARKHALSSYVPMCRRCGLILCTLNPPHHACPHCTSALFDGRDREALVVRLETELAEQLAKEEAARQRAIEEARAAEGAFPMLPGLQTARVSRTPPPPTTTRSVISLNSETKRVTVSSYSTPAPSRPASRGDDREEEGRVPGPPEEVSYIMEALDPERPWKDMRAGDLRYVPLPQTAGTRNANKRKSKKAGEGGSSGTASKAMDVASP